MTVIALGEVTVDWLSLERGRDIMAATNFYRYAGGNTANVAIGLARLGVDVVLVAKIGSDFHGNYLSGILTAEGVDLSGLVEDPRYHTAQCYMTVTDEGLPVYRNWPRSHAADMLSSDDVREEIFERASFVHSTGISLVNDPRRTAVTKGIDLSRKRDIVVSFDACFPTGQGGAARDAALHVMHNSHIVKMNLEELAYWSGHDPAIDMRLMVKSVQEFLQPVALVVTLGAEGAMIYAGGEEIYCPPKKVATVCDVGAGDAFMAGMIFSLTSLLPATGRIDALKSLGKESWAMVGNAGAVCGALCTLAIGATESFPRLKELRGLIQTPSNA